MKLGRAVLLLVVVMIVAFGIWQVRSRAQVEEPGLSTRITTAAGAAKQPVSGGVPGASLDELRRELAQLPQDSAEVRAIQARALASMGIDPNGWEHAPLPDVIDALEAAADAGDAKAAYVLGRRSADCLVSLAKHTPQGLLDGLREEVESVRERNLDRPDVNLGNIRRRWQGDLDRYEQCQAIGYERLADAMDWLEVAGRSGDIHARLRFADHAVKQYKDDRAALIRNIEQAARQRELAQTWLEEAVAAGNESALSQIMTAYGDGTLYPRDERMQRTYGFVEELVRSRRGGDFDTLWANGATRFGDRLSAADWDRVDTDGRRIFDQYFRARPVWPNGPPDEAFLKRIRERVEARRAQARQSRPGN